MLQLGYGHTLAHTRPSRMRTQRAHARNEENTSMNVAPVSAKPPLWVFDAARPEKDGSPGFLGTAATAVQKSAQARTAIAHVTASLDYLHQKLGGNTGLEDVRNAVSALHPETNTGMAIVLNANDHGRNITGSYKDGVLALGSGGTYGTGRDGKRITVEVGDVASSGDVIGHELGHSVLEASSGISPQSMKPSGEGRATHEAIADVISALQRRQWSKGADHLIPANGIAFFSDPSKPKDPGAAIWLIADKQEYDAESARLNGLVEPHAGSGVVSRAIAVIQQKLGWEDTESLVFDALKEHRFGKLTFADTAAGLRASATSLWGANDPRTPAVIDTLTAAGLPESGS